MHRTTCFRAAALWAAALAISPAAVERFSSYAPTVTVHDFETAGDTLWVASSGGLCLLNTKTNNSELFTDQQRFPDLRLTALAWDNEGNLWMGTGAGYLYKRTPKGVHQVYSSYRMAKWDVLDLHAYGNYLLVASTKGLSVFDRTRGLAIKNAVKFADFRNPRVNTVTVHNDTLYLGCPEGVARLDISGGKLLGANFYDWSIWSVSRNETAVVDFYVDAGKIQPSFFPNAILNGSRIYADSVAIHLGTSQPDTLRGAGHILKLHGNGGKVWVGTEENYFYSYLGKGNFSSYSINGPYSQITEKVYVARNGDIWVTPGVPAKVNTVPWYQGVARMRNGKWELFNSYTLGSETFGYLGGNKDFKGICETSNGLIWFGTSGGNIKVHNVSTGFWGQYYVGEKDSTRFLFLPPKSSPSFFNGSPVPPWGKTDAIVEDSSGYVWFSVWDHYAGSVGCFDKNHDPDPTQSDPLKASYRWYFPNTSVDLWMKTIYAMNVDRTGRIFVGDAEGGRLVIFTCTGNPLAGNYTVLYNEVDYQPAILDMKTTPDNSTWVVSSKGLFRFESNSVSPVKIESLPQNITCIEAEESNVLWLGTAGNGLIKYMVDSSKAVSITTDDGLISDYITDLSLDRTHRQLWIATDYGLSRYSLGGMAAPGNAGGAVAYPNPFSISRRNQSSMAVKFTKMPAGSKVRIYSIDGSLVGEPPMVGVNAAESSCEWRPPSRIVPGTYFYVVSPGQEKGKLLLIP